MKRPTKAVIAAAGFGTRFLPQTKAMPKEMLPIIDKPVIQYLVEDLVEAGIKDIIIVGSSSKRAIEDHFDVPNEDLLNNLRAGGPKKRHYIDELNKLSNLANFIYIRQKGPYGNATPLANAAHLLHKDEPFIYLFADDIVVSKPNTFTQMVQAHEELGGSIINCLRVTKDEEYDKYGIFGGDEVREGVLHVKEMIEKPGKERAPSDYYHVSSFVFEPDILEYIERGMENLQDDQEFYVSDSLITPMLADGKNFYGCIMKDSKRYDTGDKLEYLKTVIDFGFNHPEMGPDLIEYTKRRLVDQE